MIAAEWAGTRDWMGKRCGKNTLADKHKFVIFALDRMDLCTTHRKGKGNGKGKRKGAKTPRDLGQPDTIINKRDVGTTLQLCGDRWSASGLMVTIQWEKSTKRRLEQSRRYYTNGGARSWPVQCPRSTTMLSTFSDNTTEKRTTWPT